MTIHHEDPPFVAQSFEDALVAVIVRCVGVAPSIPAKAFIHDPQDGQFVRKRKGCTLASVTTHMHHKTIAEDAVLARLDIERGALLADGLGDQVQQMFVRVNMIEGG